MVNVDATHPAEGALLSKASTIRPFDMIQHFRCFARRGLLCFVSTMRIRRSSLSKHEAVMDKQVKCPKGWLLGMSMLAFATACVPVTDSQRFFCWTDVKSGAMSCTPIRPGQIQYRPVGGGAGFVSANTVRNSPSAPVATGSTGGGASASSAGVAATSGQSAAAAIPEGAVAVGPGSAAAASSAGVAVSSGTSSASASSAGVSVTN